MKHKTAELEGALLDAAVAKARGLEWEADPYADGFIMAYNAGFGMQAPLGWVLYAPSQLWADGGPIIERERIELLPYAKEEQGWYAAVRPPTGRGAARDGSTPLIAAMRAYVASKFGEEVELP